MSDQDIQKIELNNTDSVAALPADDTVALPPSNVVALDSGDDVSALPSGYEVVVNDSDSIDEEVSTAEEFGDELISVQAVIRRYSEQQEKLSKEIKDRRDSIRNLFENNEELQKAEEAQKTTSTDVKQKKQRIKESPEAVQLQMKMKELQEEMAEIQQSLSNHLLRYFQMTGSQVIEEPDGGEREFSVKARLKGKKRSE